jgi:hypothetical protein
MESYAPLLTRRFDLAFHFASGLHQTQVRKGTEIPYIAHFESFALARAAWVNDGGSVDEQYYRQQIKVVDERLALAGLRLAALLNEVFGHASPQEFLH